MKDKDSKDKDEREQRSFCDRYEKNFSQKARYFKKSDLLFIYRLKKALFFSSYQSSSNISLSECASSLINASLDSSTGMF
jgi:hypothetical protein